MDVTKYDWRWQYLGCEHVMEPNWVLTARRYVPVPCPVCGLESVPVAVGLAPGLTQISRRQ